MELTYILTQNQNVSKIGVESNTICICDIQLQFLIHFTWLNCIKNRSWLLHTLTLTQSQNVSKIGAKLITICIYLYDIYVCVWHSTPIFDTFYSLKLVSSQNFGWEPLQNSVIGGFAANYNNLLIIILKMLIIFHFRFKGNLLVVWKY